MGKSKVGVYVSDDPDEAPSEAAGVGEGLWIKLPAHIGWAWRSEKGNVGHPPHAPGPPCRPSDLPERS